ncbi:alpha/beta hydrolase [Leifsonia sp. H3M29-4]|uniref:alpha/beta fold hydrolase n=1 Tax=Salinibacterium metalliresistens TaxID=3031321 RepID=UPI0023DC6DCB|nr:alpha/beta hydrolase [Salinibacterium metalliresistens]MDF1478462.1 alpha/beta hydrolase [Salinibacterium metalliresistens]
MTVSLPIQTQLIPTRLGNISVRIVGTGPAAILWHSMFVDGASWDGLIPALAAERTLYIVDGPGYGASDELETISSIEEGAEAAAELLRGLGIREPVDWVGNAWGGHTGMALASSRPALVASLIAISSPTQPIDAALSRKVRFLTALLRVLGPVGPVRSAILENQFTDENRANPEIARSVTGALSRASKRSLANTVESFIIRRLDVTASLSSISAPTLFVTGDDRPEWTPEAMDAAAALVPHSRTAIIAGSRVVVPAERPAELAEVILEFWAEL